LGGNHRLDLANARLIAQVIWQMICQIRLAKPLAKLTERVVGVAIRLLRVRRRLREIDRIVVQILLARPVDDVQVFCDPMLRPAEADADVRNDMRTDVDPGAIRSACALSDRLMLTAADHTPCVKEVPCRLMF
ncbi:hypothetical protein, partial [Mesorhizobium intechi]|uniref:hypothetical protein n=1 Tax=Mesorhizobium intechi TaxID=537601 RepID=UPI001ABFE882